MDEGLLQVFCPAARNDCLRRIGDQNLAGMHQRDPVAECGLVHEMGRDEDGHAVAPGKVGQQSPKAVTRHGIHTRRGFIEDQDVGAVDQGDGERQPLTHPERQGVGQFFQRLDEAKPVRKFL